MSVAKKFLALAVVAVVLALGVVGCSSPAREIKGNCETVVKECQNVAKGDNVTVIVSGWPADGTDTTGDELLIKDGSSGDVYVFVLLKDGQGGNKITGRNTFKGTLDTDKIFTDAIYLKNAEIVQ